MNEKKAQSFKDQSFTNGSAIVYKNIFQFKVKYFNVHQLRKKSLYGKNY